ncbi:hypothetical protein [Maridesulfovibrio hydrothermalis]|uniref:Uncharacterized protein n=1 Tax=Maridesulfovibrio hydrothermalis AM13 = DSM 14728 TaxID=1121451 RepID=L0R8W4_9BACT|nr:hypothetical protein [Maridesulfovibrio hydrothermalis]CCO23199.1 conserved exported protein of unknown function [Maridesulfovibrio hydrothermalis AM13 = DSM 14728]
MKKLISVFTVLLVLAASSVFAAVTAEFPAFFNQTLGTTYAKENGTQLYFTGFGVNATAGVAAGQSIGKVQFYSSNRTATNKSEVFLINATGVDGGAFNGTLNYYNGTIKQQKSWDNGTGTISFNSKFGNVAGLTQVSSNSTLNGTQYYVPAGNYQMMVGIVNATINATSGKRRVGEPGFGVSLSMIYQNGTFKNIASSSDTWDYYAYGQRKGYPVVIFGQVKITALSGASKASVKYYLYNGTDKTDKTSSWIAYNATGLEKNNNGGSLALTRNGGLTLFDNSTINTDGNMVTGYVRSGSQRLFAVMVKSASNISANDVKNRAFNMVYTGSGTATKGNLGNATAGILQFNVDNSFGLQGNSRAITSGSNRMTAANQGLGGYSVAVADTNQFKLSQSNMTIYQGDGKTVAGYFIGKQSADKVFSVGIYETVDGGATHRSLAFLIPTVAVTSAIQSTGAGYQNNATVSVTNLTANSTAYSQISLRARWSGIPSNFTPLTSVKGYSATAGSKQKGDFYYSTQFEMTGVGGRVDSLRLYKVMPDSTTVRAFSYAGAPTPAVEGSWWISQSTADGYLNDQSVLDPTKDYFVNWVVKDNGSYDSNATALGIVDPVVLGSVPTSSSSSSSGCVFNPAAGFGLEWLLLMLAPMVAVVRSRFKK